MRITSPSSRHPVRTAGGFTLVELLVVIGIIALLIGILLPSLSKARQSAQTVKCAAALQQIGLGFQLYANDQKGYWPVAKLVPSKYPTTPALSSYDIDGFGYTDAQPAYWYNFIAPYVNANGTGYSITNQYQAHKNNIFWGCPAFEQYMSGAGINTEPQVGYGMNPFPTYTPEYPSGLMAQDPPNEAALFDGGPGQRRFYKQIEYTNPGARCLVADCQFWLVQSGKITAQSGWPPAIAPQGQSAQGNSANNVPGANGTTTIDIYRHGKYPGVNGKNFDPFGGHILYNILYCDGHVQQLSTAQEAYQSTRMKFPG